MKRLLIIMTIAAIAVSMVFFGVSCKEAVKEEATETTATETTTTETTATTDAKELTVGVVIPYALGWFAAYKQGYEIIAEKEGIKINWQYHNYKAEEETEAIQNLITLGVDAINLTAATPDSGEYSISLANDANIPIQITESGIVPGSGKIVANMDYNWEQIYRDVAKEIRNAEMGPISLVFISGFAGSPVCEQQIDGLTEQISKEEDFEMATDTQYGDYATDKSLSIQQSLVQSGLEFNVVLGACQEITEGIIQGLKDENVDRSEVKVVTVNGGPMDIENFKNGLLDYAMCQSPAFHGMINALNLISYLKGGTYQELAYSPYVWATAENWEEKYIPWEMDLNWLPVAEEFVKTGNYKPELKK